MNPNLMAWGVFQTRSGGCFRTLRAQFESIRIPENRTDLNAGPDFETPRISQPIDIWRKQKMTRLKTFGVAAILSMMIATPVFAQAAMQEPGAFAFYHPDADVLNAGRPTPAETSGAIAAVPHGSGGAYASMDDGANTSSCAPRYHSYDPGSGTFLGYDGQRHPCQ
jgi:hypothetical protein